MDIILGLVDENLAMVENTLKEIEKLSFSKTLDWISNPDTAKRSKLYYFLCMLNYMLQTANPTSPFKKKLKALLTENEDIISLNAMGFFENWENEIIWNNKK